MRIGLSIGSLLIDYKKKRSVKLLSNRVKELHTGSLITWIKLASDMCCFSIITNIIIISPPENDSFRKDLCFTADVYFFLQREISKMCGPTGVKFCMMVSTRHYFVMPVQNFGGHTSKKFQGPKTCKIWPDFGRLRSSVVNISETDEYIQNRIFISSIAISPALGETSPVNFGPVTLEISMLNRTHSKCIIRKTIFRPIGGAAPPNFYTC